MKKRNLFDEMIQGVEEMAAHRECKITLRQVDVDEKPAPTVTVKKIVAIIPSRKATRDYLNRGEPDAQD